MKDKNQSYKRSRLPLNAIHLKLNIPCIYVITIHNSNNIIVNQLYNINHFNCKVYMQKIKHGLQTKWHKNWNLLFAFFCINVIDVVLASCCIEHNNLGKYPVLFIFRTFNTSCYHITRACNKPTVNLYSTAQWRRPTAAKNTAASEHFATSNFHKHFIMNQKPSKQ